MLLVVPEDNKTFTTLSLLILFKSKSLGVKISKIGKIAGCEITEGIAKTGAKVRLLRDNLVLHTGQMSTLRRHKDDVREVKEGLECGIGLEKYHDIKEGDVLELFEAKEVARSISKD